MRPLRIALLIPVALTALAAGACSSSSGGGGSGSSGAAAPPGTQAPTAAGSTITIQNFAFGSPLTVKRGQPVSVVNQDSAPHTVTADDGHSFDAKAGSSGGTGSFTAPMTPGTYPFHCSVHPSMHGTLVVQA